MKIQYVSDTHLELFPGFRFSPEDVRGDILVLAGDIAAVPSPEYTDFVKDCVTCFGEGKVFVVLGNHEAYGNGLTWDETVEEARRLLFSLGANLLHRDSFELGDGIRIAGTTLWSHVEDQDRSDVQCFIADYRCIKGLTSVYTANAMHAIDVAWIRQQIEFAEKKGERLVIVTHHAPSLRGTSSPRNTGSILQSAFATNLEYLFVDVDVVRAWIFGHTHHTCELFGGKLVSNPRGYRDDATGFDPRKVLHV